MNTKQEISLKAAAALGTKYDASVKEVFQWPEIIAPILQMAVPEYKDYSVEEVIKMINKASISSDPVDSASAMAAHLPTEMSSIGEKVITYDSHFKALNPALSRGNIKFHLHIDLEFQNNYKPTSPSYPIVKRAIYYGAREISSQLGILTEGTDYASLEKVYSIWICNENVPSMLKNTVTSYSIIKKDEIGTTDELDKDYDLMTVILIRRGKDSTTGIFDYLDGVFQSDIDRIEKYVDIRSKDEIVEGVKSMTGLGESIFIKGYNSGHDEGVSEGLQEGLQHSLDALTKHLMSTENLTEEEARERASSILLEKETV